MQMTMPIYRKGDKWFRTMTEVPDYEEKRFIELYDDGLDFRTITLDELVRLNELGLGKVASMGLHEWYVEGEHIKMSGHDQEN